MASRSTRQNEVDEKLLAAIERNDQVKFNDHNNADKKFIKEKEERSELARLKVERLKELRMSAAKVSKKNKSERK